MDAVDGSVVLVTQPLHAFKTEKEREEASVGCNVSSFHRLVGLGKASREAWDSRSTNMVGQQEAAC